MPFEVIVAKPAGENLKLMRKRDQQIIYDAIADQLVDQPNKPTRNRKRLEKNDVAPWELRVGAFRIFYDVDVDAQRVIVLAIGQKDHNTLRIGGEVVDL